MMKLIGVTVVTMAWLFGAYTPSLACSCAYIGPLEMYETADGVFTGTVQTITVRKHLGFPYLDVAFRVTAVWKGISTSTVHVATSISDASCGVFFEPAKEYLVYALDNEVYPQGRWRTHLCTRTRSVEYAQEDFDALGEPSPEPLGNSTWGKIKALYED
jgi:hypothetical protein